MGTPGPPRGAAAALAWERKDDTEEETVKLFEGLPWWVKWVAVPVIAIVVFGGMIASAIGFLFWLLFKVLIFVLLVAGLVYVVKKFTSSSSDSRDKW